MKNKHSWPIQILRGAMILVATVLLILAILQRAIIDPRTCQVAIDELTRQPWASTLAQATLDAVPESAWTPYLPCDVDALTQVYAKSANPASFEAPVCTITTSTARYMLGIEDGDTVRNAILGLLDYLDGDWAENTRAVLWESLPQCAGDARTDCAAADPNIQRQQAIEHAAWWKDYLPKLRQWLGNSIISQVNALPLLQPWIMRLHLLDILPIILLALASIPWRRHHSPTNPGRPRPVADNPPTDTDKSTQNTMQPSYPLHDVERVAGGRVRSDRVRTESLPRVRGRFRGGAFLLCGITLTLLAILALFANLPAPRAPFTAASTWQPITALAWQSLWRALLPAFGWRALSLGAILFSTGLLLTAMVMHRPWQRWLLLTTTIVLVTGALMLDQVYRDDQSPVIINTGTQATPTTWPTFTPTATATPTPTPTPSAYWPVQPATPIPTPSAPIDSGNLTQVACFQSPDDAPIQHIQAESNGFTVFQPETYTRYALPSLSRITRGANTYPIDETSTYLLNDRVAITQDESLWIFNIPDWSPVLLSRFATFANITSVYSDPRTNTNRLFLGLDNGFVWEVRPSTGALLAMREVTGLPVRNLVQCGSNLIFQDSDRGMDVVEWPGGDVLHELYRSPYYAETIDFVCAGDQHAISLEADGRVLLWNLGNGEIENQSTLGTDPATTFQHHDDLLWIATNAGNIVSIDPESLDNQQYDLNAEPITTFALLDNTLIFTGNNDGTVCIWESVD